MHHEEIEAFCIAKTGKVEKGIRAWLERLGVSDIDAYMKEVEDLTGPEAAIALSGKRCYMSFEVGANPNITRIRKCWTEYIDNILKSGHGSVFEHATYSYGIEGLTRVCTAELNRHRAGVAISEGSQRFIRFGEDIPFWMPLSLRGDDRKSIECEWPCIKLHLGSKNGLSFDHYDKSQKKHISRLVFEHIFQQCEDAYKMLEEIWLNDPVNHMMMSDKKKITSCLRRIIPMGVCTGGIWTLNMRALRHVIALRSTPHAEEEIAYLAGLVAKDIIENEPRIFGDFKQDDQGFWVPKYKKV